MIFFHSLKCSNTGCRLGAADSDCKRAWVDELFRGTELVRDVPYVAHLATKSKALVIERPMEAGPMGCFGGIRLPLRGRTLHSIGDTVPSGQLAPTSLPSSL